MRRSLAIVGASVVALLCIAPAAVADESISDRNSSWNGSALDPGNGNVAVGTYTLSGTFQHVLNRQVEVTVSAAPARTGACAVTPTTLRPAPAPQPFSVTLAIPCNGTYTLAANAVTTDDNAFFASESARLDRTVAVAAPAPTVTGVVATADGRTIRVIWDDMRPQAPDLAGYSVERRIDDEEFTPIATNGAGDRTFDDSVLPVEAGKATYRIFATRPDATDGDKVSAASYSKATPFIAARPDTTTTTGPGGSTGTVTGGSGSTGSGDQAASGGGRASGGSAPRVSPPRVFSGSFLPPLLRPAAQTITTTEDTGFDEALPYEQREQGEQDAVLPKDAMASILTDGQPGRGMAIPVATALVLAIWAFHLRMLARAARPLD